MTTGELLSLLVDLTDREGFDSRVEVFDEQGPWQVTGLRSEGKGVVEIEYG